MRKIILKDKDHWLYKWAYKKGKVPTYTLPPDKAEEIIKDLVVDMSNEDLEFKLKLKRINPKDNNGMYIYEKVEEEE